MQIDSSEVWRLVADLETAAPRLGKKVATIIRSTAGKMERIGKEIAPVRSGELVEDIKARTSGDGRTGSMAAILESKKKQGFFQEHGTATHPAQPWAGPTLERVTPEALSALEKAAQEAVLP